MMRPIHAQDFSRAKIKFLTILWCGLLGAAF
jgi:hypothetical protein